MNSNLFNLQFNIYRFLSADKRNVYLTILNALYEERLAHQIEIFHDHLYLKVTAAVEQLTAEDYHEALFRQDIETLVDWGNIVRKLEGRRVRSLSDNSLRRNILKISEETFQLIRHLLQQSRPAQQKSLALGFLLLQDLDSMLDEFENLLEEFYDGKRNETVIERSLHVIESMDAKIDAAVAELTRLADQLHSFLDAGSVFDSERYADMISQLEDYNKAWLSRLNTVVDNVFSRLKNLEKHLCFDEFFAALVAFNKAEDNTDNLSRQKFALLVAFFDPGSGRLDFYCKRVHDELYEALRRIRNYVRIRSDKTLRIQDIRSRITEMATADADQCIAWVDQLFAPVIVPMLAAAGTPAEKCQAPLPRRSASAMAGVKSTRAIGAKKLSVEASRELERQKIQKLNEFFSSKVLQGKPQNLVENALFTAIDDAKTYIQGLKMAISKGGRQAKLLQVAFERPGRECEPATFDLEDCFFASSNYTVRSTRDE